jgi:GTP-binding protein
MRAMKISSIEMVTSAVSRKQYPVDGLPEVAVAGRSNVGKSSMINTLLNRKSMARTSSQPGRTRTINFYRINGKFFLVDLPGYGYAKISKSEQLRWGRMIDEYLNSRRTLMGVLQLVDARHKPTELDRIMFDWIKSSGHQRIVIATKCDKIPKSRVSAHMRLIQDQLGMATEDIIIPFSSVNKEGVIDVWNVLEQLCGLNYDQA